MANVLAIGDTHCPAMLEGYVDFLRDIYQRWGCDRVVHIGDVVDWHAIHYHEKEPSLPTAAEEIKQARAQVKTLRKAFPKLDVLTGNHDDLPRRQMQTARLPIDILRNPAELWETPNWTWHPRFSALEIDGVLYAHGDKGRGGKTPALLNAQDHFQSFVQGHFHGLCFTHHFANHKPSGVRNADRLRDRPQARRDELRQALQRQADCRLRRDSRRGSRIQRVDAVRGLMLSGEITLNATKNGRHCQTA